MERLAGSQNVTRWENMNRDILAIIFGKLNVIDVIMGASRVCVSWFLASHQKTLWKTVDLATLREADFKDPRPRRTNACIDYDIKPKQILKNIMLEITLFSRTVPKHLFLNIYVNLRVCDFKVVAKRMPNIKKLMLPLWRCDSSTSKLDENKIKFVFNQWKNLETLMIIGQDYLSGYSLGFKAIAENCNNISNLKLVCKLYPESGYLIVSNLPRLTKLSLQSSIVHELAVFSLIVGHQNLKILNLSHCIFYDNPGNYHKELTNDLVQIATKKLDKFIMCLDVGCMICKKLLNNCKGHSSIFKVWEEHLRNDEIEEFKF